MVRKYTAQKPMEVIPEGAKAWPEMMSQEAGAMARFVMTGAGVAVRWQQERDNLEIGKDISALNSYQFTLMRQLEEDWRSKKFTDPKQFKQVEEDYGRAREMFLNKLLKGKRGNISDRVRGYADDIQVSQSKEFYNSLFAKEKEFNSVEGLKVVESAIQRGNRDEAMMQIDEFSYWFGPAKTKILKDTLDTRMVEVQHQNFLEQVAVDMRGMEISEALSYANQIPRTAISEPERNGLVAQRKRQEEIATATTEPKVYWKALREVTIDPDGTTEEYLASLVGKGLTTDDYKEFMGIKESNETVSSNTFWKSEAWDYIEKQILEVSTMTGILYGSGEQFALAAQAHMAFEKAIADAAKAEKPLKGRELLELAHEVMLPFRKKIKPLMPGEKIPETLGGRKVSPEYKPPPPPKKPPSEQKAIDEYIVDKYPKPKTVAEFENTFRHISDKGERKRYYDKWANEVYK